MSESYTIGQLAKAAAVAPSTVRYYERRGLLIAESRSKSNYRLYSCESLKRLRFVKAAQQAGFTLGDIEVLLGLGEQRNLPCHVVQQLIGDRLKTVRTQLAELSRIETMLEEWLKVCADLQSQGRCGVLEGLSSMASDCPSEKICKKSEKSS
jgi:MerR family mercuric resistance operon transcriptional regulator